MKDERVREIINLKTDKELEDITQFASEEFKLIKEIEHSFDAEKGFVECDIMVQRNSDGLFFKGEYIKGTAGVDVFDNLTLQQVFPISVSTIVYE